MQDPFNYEAFRERIAQLASSTREVRGPETLPMPDIRPPAGGGSAPPRPTIAYGSQGNELASAVARWEAEYGGERISEGERAAQMEGYQDQLARAAAAGTQYATDRGALGAQGEQSATALELMGASTETYMRNLGALGQEARTNQARSAEIWGEAAGQVDEYVQASRARMGEVFAELDEVWDEWNTDRDFARSHAMQAAVQTSLGQMRAEERNIAQTYGAGSPEAMQFRESGRRTLGAVFSQIETGIQQMREESYRTYFTVKNEAMWKQNMYTSYQEQQHVETLRYLAQASDQYALQTSQTLIGLEQMQMAGMENVANWIQQTPVYSMDILPLIETVLGA